MSDLNLFIKLRDCFQSGYTLPQYCIDNGIQRPLIVGIRGSLQNIWEIHVQFCMDKRLKAQFCFLDSPAITIDFSARAAVAKLRAQSYSQELIDNCDKIIFLSSDKKKLTNDKTIYLDDLVEYFIRKTYCEIPLLHFLQRYPKVKLFLTNMPHITRYKDGLNFNKKLQTIEDMLELLKSNKDTKVKTPLDKFGYTNQEVADLIKAPRIIKSVYGKVPLKDTSADSIQHIKDGRRMTAYQPEHYQNRIWFVGSCHQYGINAPYDKTIESYLQQMLNEAKLPYRVENEGQHYFNRRQDCFYNLQTLEPAPGDIIFIWVNNTADNIPFCDVSDAFDPPHDYKEIFALKGHVNELGYKILAEKYFEFLKTNNFFSDKDFEYPAPPPPRLRYGVPPQFEHWDKVFLEVTPPASVKPPVKAATDVKPPVKAAVGVKPPVKAAVGVKAPVKAATDVKPPVKAATDVKPPVKAAVGVKPPVKAAVGVKAPVKAATDVKPPVKAAVGVKPPVKAAVGVKAPVKAATDVKPPVKAAAGVKPPVKAATNVKPPVKAAAGVKPPVKAATGVKPPVKAAAGVKPPVKAAAGVKPPVKAAADVKPPVKAAADVKPPVKAATDTKPTVETANDTKSTVETPNDIKPTVKAATDTKPTVETANDTKPTVETANDTKPTVKAATDTKPTVETAKDTKPTVETAKDTKPTVETASDIKPTVETPNDTKPTVETPNDTKPTVETASDIKPTVETANDTKAPDETPTSIQAQETATTN